MSELRTKVLRDISKSVAEGDNVDFCHITSTDGAHDAVTLQRMITGEPLARLYKNIFTGVDYVATPEHHVALLLHPSSQPGSGNVVLADRKWAQPRVFSRPILGFAR